jgi:hypothetical protein
MVDQFASGRQFFSCRLTPSLSKQEAAGSLVDVVLPRREQANVAISRKVRTDGSTRFEDQERQTAFD